jgi:GT2 family glycosyltransferase
MRKRDAAMHVAVVIVGFRNTGDLVHCIDALGRTAYPDFEVVIVENGGPEAFARDVAALPGSLPGGQPVLLVEAPGNLGFAGGVNHGIHHAPGADAWYVLNPDAVVTPATVGELVARLERGDVDAVGGIIYSEDGTVQCMGGIWNGWFARAVSIGADAPASAPFNAAAIEAQLDYLHGASMLIHRRFRQKAGLMREDYFLYAEEIEWFLRGAKLGTSIGFAPKATVIHARGTTTGAGENIRSRSKMPVYLDARNRMLVVHDQFPARLPIVAAASLLFLVLRLGRKRAWRQIGYGAQGWLAGLAGERGVPGWMKS